MINIFEVFLPQLLRYPNPADPLNGDAAVLLLREPKTYESKVRDYISRYATKEAVEEMDDSSDSEYEMSDAEMSEDEDEPVGQMELSWALVSGVCIMGIWYFGGRLFCMSLALALDGDVVGFYLIGGGSGIYWVQLPLSI
jgi:hypothetical protein